MPGPGFVLNYRVFSFSEVKCSYYPPKHFRFPRNLRILALRNDSHWPQLPSTRPYHHAVPSVLHTFMGVLVYVEVLCRGSAK